MSDQMAGIQRGQAIPQERVASYVEPPPGMRMGQVPVEVSAMNPTGSFGYPVPGRPGASFVACQPMVQAIAMNGGGPPALIHVGDSHLRQPSAHRPSVEEMDRLSGTLTNIQQQMQNYGSHVPVPTSYGPVGTGPLPTTYGPAGGFEQPSAAQQTYDALSGTLTRMGAYPQNPNQAVSPRKGSGMQDGQVPTTYGPPGGRLPTTYGPAGGFEPAVAAIDNLSNTLKQLGAVPSPMGRSHVPPMLPMGAIPMLPMPNGLPPGPPVGGPGPFGYAQPVPGSFVPSFPVGQRSWVPPPSHARARSPAAPPLGPTISVPNIMQPTSPGAVRLEGVQTGQGMDRRPGIPPFFPANQHASVLGQVTPPNRPGNGMFEFEFSADLPQWAQRLAGMKNDGA